MLFRSTRAGLSGCINIGRMSCFATDNTAHRLTSGSTQQPVPKKSSKFQDMRANFKMFQFGQGQGGRIIQPEEYIEYFED
jgi:hypothetical protein